MSADPATGVGAVAAGASPAPRALTPGARGALVVAIAVIAVLPIGRGAELPWLVGAIAGLVLAITRWRALAALPALRLLLVLFAAYWLPAALSAIDAVRPEKTWTTVAAALRFAPFALAMVVLARGDARWSRALALGVGGIVALWALDALVQAATGWSVAGRLAVDRVSGVFGDENLKLGPALAVLSPFALDAAWRRGGRGAFALAWLLIAAAVLVAGARAGWIIYAIVTLAYFWRLAGDPRRFALAVMASLVVAIGVGAIAYQASARFAARIDRTLALGNGSVAAVDFALAGRVPIFRTAVAIALAHPVNGVGVRGFRYAYPDYAASSDPWIDPATRTGALHPHQIVLEVAAETGAPGVAAWLLAALIAWRAWRRVPDDRRDAGRPAAIALVAMSFPLNTHFAFYSSFWSLLFWWLIAAWLAAWPVPPDPETRR